MLSIRPFVPVRPAPRRLLFVRRANYGGGPSRTRPWPPTPAGGASTSAPAGGAGGGAPVDAIACIGAPAPTLSASLAEHDARSCQRRHELGG
jgi:hypothetical protein